MRVYHFLSATYGLEALKERHIKVSRINALNDPFELLQYRTENYVTRFVLRERRGSMNKRWGIVCFSSSYESPVQWAHYADVHRGVCLGFEVPDELLLKIEYVKNRALFAEFQEAMKLAPLDFLRHMLSRKFDHWAYEMEHRLFVDFGRDVKIDWLCFANFCPDLELKQVIFGARFGDKSEARKIVRGVHPGAEIFSVSPSAFEFKMIRPVAT